MTTSPARTTTTSDPSTTAGSASARADGGGGEPVPRPDAPFVHALGAEITRSSGSNFALSFVLLGPERRRAMDTFYGWCRAVDDAVDEAPDAVTAEAGIAFWRGEVAAIAAGAEPTSPLGRELAWAVERFRIPVPRLEAVLDGCAMDLDAVAAARSGAPLGPDAVRFADAAALDDYCWHVASAVGLCCLPIFGAVDAVDPDADGGEAAADPSPDAAAAEEYAEKLGLALQLTNILRDLRSDAEEGRIYVPRADLEAHGVEPVWLAGDGPAEAYADGGPVHRLVDALAARARRRFAEARAVKPRRFRRNLVPAEVMGAVYRDLLERVEARKGHIEGPRPRVPKSTRVRCLLGVLCSSIFLGR